MSKTAIVAGLGIVLAIACNDRDKPDAKGPAGATDEQPDLTPSGLAPAKTFDAPPPAAAWVPVSLAPQSPERDAGFGTAVAASGERIVVGAPGRATFVGPGSAHVYERKDGTWTSVATLAPAEPRKEGHFGRTVAIDGDTIVVGSGATHNPPTPGLVRVFERKGVAWSEVATLAVPNADEERSVAVVGISGTTIVVGHPDRKLGEDHGAGAVALFEKKDGRWHPSGELMASDKDALAKHCQANFGNAVAIAGDVIAVGARQAEVDGVEMSGAGYVFERKDNAWQEVVRLPARKVERWSSIGHAVATDGVRVAFALAGPRTVWVLMKEDGEWRDADSVDAAYRVASGEDEVFGSRVAIRGSRVAIGVLPSGGSRRPPVKPGTNEVDLDTLERMRAPRPGAVQLHVRATDGGWTRASELARATPEIGDELGLALALGDDFLVAGAPRGRLADDGSDAGDVVVFAPPGA